MWHLLKYIASPDKYKMGFDKLVFIYLSKRNDIKYPEVFR